MTASAIGIELARLGLRTALDGDRAEATRAEWSERLRANALRLDPVTPPDSPALRDNRRELRVITAQLQRDQGDDRALLARQRELESAIRRRARHAPGDGGASDTRAPDRRALAEALGDRALVELIELDGELTALVLAGGRLTRHPLGAAEPVRSEHEWLRFALSRIGRLGRGAPQLSSLREGARRSAQTLDELLIVPLASPLGDRELVLAPTGALHALPWALLPSLRGRPLTIAPSAAIWLMRQGLPRRRRNKVVLAAGPHLRHARAELNAVAELYPRAITLQGRAADVGSVLQAIDGASIAHFACHGRMRSDSPLFSSLELADGPLNVYELQHLRRPPELVVLSSCDLATSATHPGDELLGFAAALLNMGTRTVIASTVPVPDAAAKRLMRALHEQLAARRPPAAALAHAQRLVGTRRVSAGRLRLPRLGLTRRSPRRRSVTIGRGGDRGREPLGRLQRGEVTGAGSSPRLTSAKNSSSRSPQAGGNSGSCSGHSTVVGTWIRASGAGGRSARLVATVPEPERYQPIDAVNAPGGA